MNSHTEAIGDSSDGDGSEGDSGILSGKAAKYAAK
jgi:hypothetical protein